MAAKKEANSDSIFYICFDEFSDALYRFREENGRKPTDQELQMIATKIKKKYYGQVETGE